MLLIFILFSNLFLAHKPKVKIENFGNVKTYYASDFNFNYALSSEEMKIHILGKLSEDIAKRLGYKDTILIEYRVRFNKQMDRLTILEEKSSNYKIHGLIEGNILKSNGSGLAVRIIDTKINVDEILKLVEYTIINRQKINEHLSTIKFSYDKDNSINILANLEEFIKTIIKKRSKLVEEVMGKSIVLLDNKYLRTRLLWENNEFIFGINTISPSDGQYETVTREEYKVKDFKYYVDSRVSDFFLIFEDKNRLMYFDGIEKNKGLILETKEKEIDYPFNISKDRFNGKVIVFNNGYYFYVYDVNKKTTLKIE